MWKHDFSPQKEKLLAKYLRYRYDDMYVSEVRFLDPKILKN